MEIYLSSNLKLLRKNRKLSQEEVAGKLNLTRSSYSGYENGVAEPGVENLLKMSKFYRIPLDDLLKRDFSKLTENDWEAIQKGVYADVKGRRLRVLTSMVSEQNDDVIEMIPQKASAGYTLGYSDPDYLKVLPTFQLPFLKKDKKYRSFPIQGDSMPPVSPGSYVVAEYIQNWESLKNNHPYIIITKEEGIVFKIVNKIPGKENVIQLSSTNPLYEPYLLDINEVIEIWKFVNYISHDLPEVTISEDDLLKSVKSIQKQVNEMRSFMQTDQ
ncbi:XRE family transcriptional regulator [Brumimicrobium aurantiacum]|uniref:Helix-turn-helix domain-containing protein n=1 Tax=Brumimicrobium aurantiacum TaxID=1737063 RepID=A0A3E1EW61_9FLAO|nr:LexA family transcriptional regulator [Brumimicrobium aurantiacum]RFC53796.1 helix-turn-helix domain-containing protein [Brumimicrobium aurantiacum]